MGFLESKGRLDSKETRVSRGPQVYQASVGNRDHRESQERKVPMVPPDLRALRVFLVTWDHQERTALKDQRENQGLEVYQAHEGSLAWRETRALLDHRA